MARALTPWEILIFVLAPSVPFALFVVLLRRRIMGNVYARRTVALLGLLFALISRIARWPGWWTSRRIRRSKRLEFVSDTATPQPTLVSGSPPGLLLDSRMFSRRSLRNVAMSVPPLRE